MAQGESDRNLLFGVLALQMDFITRDALIAAMNAWVLEKGKPLGQILVERRDLDEQDFALLDPLVAKHVERHGGDPERSLESLTSVSWLRHDLLGVVDPEVNATVARLGAAPDGKVDPEETATLSVGAPSSAGQRFRILRLHDSGGLGEVYVARDEELNREVALKQIKGRYADHPESRSRFLLEAEVTGGLEHPGIVPVYGLGHYPDGRPFYAMRFIRGDSLKEAIERFHQADGQPGRDPGERALALRQLLRRFVDVCNAVAYAHSRGVLHRDLKPGNVMLGPYGETLVVDWGLAKPMGRPEGVARSAEGTLRPSSGSGLTPTQMGAAVGTPPFMSPEQAAGKLDELGPASDVYSLGAMLYSLLTGRAPFTDADLGDVLRKVEAGAFPPPRQVNRTVPPALEAACLKAMAKEPGSRYLSPKALADEIEHWLGDEPVAAWREPFLMRARRWARRNRTAVSGAAAALVVGVIGLSAVAVVQSRAKSALEAKNLQLTEANAATTKAKNEAETALAETTKAKRTTEEALTQKGAALTQSEESRQRAEAVLKFLKDDVLAATRPEGQEGGLGRDVTVRKAIDAAEPKIAGAFKDQPIVEAEVRDTLGITYHYLGHYPLAIRQHERALELRRTKLGPDHPSTLTSRNNLANDYQEAGRTAEAIRLDEETLKLKESKLGPDHPDTLTSRNNLAADYQEAGRTAEAIRLDEETLRLKESKLGPDHPDTLTSRNNLAAGYVDAGRNTEAIGLLEGTLKLLETKLGPEHPHTLTGRSNLAAAYWTAGRYAESIALHEPTLKLLETKLGPEHPVTITRRSNLAVAYESLGQWADAERLLRDVLARRRKVEKPDSPLLAGDLGLLGRNLLRQSKWSEAEPLLRECLAIRAKALPDDWSRFITMSQLGGALLGQERYAEAEPLVIGGYEGMKARAAKIPAWGKPRLTEAAERVIRLYEDWGQPEKAAVWKAQLGLGDLPADVFARP